MGGIGVGRKGEGERFGDCLSLSREGGSKSMEGIDGGKLGGTGESQGERKEGCEGVLKGRGGKEGGGEGGIWRFFWGSLGGGGKVAGFRRGMAKGAWMAKGVAKRRGGSASRPLGRSNRRGPKRAQDWGTRGTHSRGRRRKGGGRVTGRERRVTPDPLNRTTTTDCTDTPTTLLLPRICRR